MRVGNAGIGQESEQEGSRPHISQFPPSFGFAEQARCKREGKKPRKRMSATAMRRAPRSTFAGFKVRVACMQRGQGTHARTARWVGNGWWNWMGQVGSYLAAVAGYSGAGRQSPPWWKTIARRGRSHPPNATRVRTQSRSHAKPRVASQSRRVVGRVDGQARPRAHERR